MLQYISSEVASCAAGQEIILLLMNAMINTVLTTADG
jgi:hypothetical protein